MLKTRYKMIDLWILIPFLSLVIFSVIAVYSASTFSSLSDYGHPNHYFFRQLVYVVLSIGSAAFFYIFPFRAMKNTRLIQLGTFVTFALLIVVLFLPPILGARRWIPFPFFNIQPAEFAKVFIIWYLAYIFSKKQDRLETEFISTAIRPGILVGAILMLILEQPDTGTAIIAAMVILLMLFSSGASVKYGLLFFLGLTIIVGLIVWFVYKFGDTLFGGDYRYERFLGWFDPFGTSQSDGHQLVNSYYALNRGGWFGVGIGNSVQKTGYLPFPYTDFIMAIVGEEMGLLGVSFVLGNLGILISRSFYIGSKAIDSFNGLICIGVGSMLLVQSLVNLAGVTGLLPITGVTFPFLSYGGSSIIALSISIALVANASRNERIKMQSLS